MLVTYKRSVLNSEIGMSYNSNYVTYQALNGPRVPGLVRRVDQRIDGSSEAERIQDVREVRHGISIELKM